MKNYSENLCIGLFGTCGSSTWRKPLIETYQKLGINYYNPQVPEDEWDVSLADIEANRLANDRIILLTITDETYAAGSLTEVGFSQLNALKLDEKRDAVVFIDKNVNEKLYKDKERAKDSLRSRALALAHLSKLKLENVYIVNSLEEMMEISIDLYEKAKLDEAFEQMKKEYEQKISNIRLTINKKLNH